MNQQSQVMSQGHDKGTAQGCKVMSTLQVMKNEGVSETQGYGSLVLLVCL